MEKIETLSKTREKKESPESSGGYSGWYCICEREQGGRGHWRERKKKKKEPETARISSITIVKPKTKTT